MKRAVSLFLLCALLLSGCTGTTGPELKQYNATFLDLFDTVTTIVGRAESPEAFRETAQVVHDALLEYHRLFDIYNDYEGITNLKTVNDAAGGKPVTVDPRIIRLLSDCKEYYELTHRRVNPAMGSVLYLWHEARNDSFNDPANAYIPEEHQLSEASAHMDFNHVIIDRERSTVQITDPQLRLDVGAIAKGWAVQRVCETAPSGQLISVGGNVCATGPKDSSGTPWVVGIQDPEGGEEYLHTLYLTTGSIVTSGDYQRCFVANGELYHHIIDPDTRMPGKHWRSVTIVCPDSGLADALSTALFLLPLEEGLALIADLDAEAMWVDAAGQRFYSPGFEALIRT